MVDLHASVNNFNSFYVELCSVMTNAYDPLDALEGGGSAELFKLRLDTFKKASQILTQIQEFSSTHQLNAMP